jgi:hypothetical protein
MMVKLKTPLSGPRGAHAAGEVVEVTDKTGARLVERDLAEPAADPAPEPTTETAGDGQVEDKAALETTTAELGLETTDATPGSAAKPAAPKRAGKKD